MDCGWRESLANHLTFIISRNNSSEMRWEQPPERGQNYQREQIITLPHRTTWNKKGGNGVGRENRSENVTFMTCTVLSLCCFFKSQAFWKSMRLFSPLTYCPGSLPYLLGVLPRSWVFQRTNIPGDKWPHSEGRLCPVSGAWTPATHRSLFDVQSNNACAFKSHFLSIHQKLLYFCLSFLRWAFTSLRSITNYSQATFTTERWLGKSTMPPRSPWHTAVETK